MSDSETLGLAWAPSKTVDWSAVFLAEQARLDEGDLSFLRAATAAEHASICERAPCVLRPPLATSSDVALLLNNTLAPFGGLDESLIFCWVPLAVASIPCNREAYVTSCRRFGVQPVAKLLVTLDVTPARFNLTAIDCGGTPLGDRGLAAITSVIRLNAATLQRINLRGTGISTVAVRLLLRVLWSAWRDASSAGNTSITRWWFADGTPPTTAPTALPLADMELSCNPAIGDDVCADLRAASSVFLPYLTHVNLQHTGVAHTDELRAFLRGRTCPRRGRPGGAGVAVSSCISREDFMRAVSRYRSLMSPSTGLCSVHTVVARALPTVARAVSQLLKEAEGTPIGGLLSPRPPSDRFAAVKGATPRLTGTASSATFTFLQYLQAVHSEHRVSELIAAARHYSEYVVLTAPVQPVSADSLSHLELRVELLAVFEALAEEVGRRRLSDRAAAESDFDPDRLSIADVEGLLATATGQAALRFIAARRRYEWIDRERFVDIAAPYAVDRRRRRRFK